MNSKLPLPYSVGARRLKQVTSNKGVLMKNTCFEYAEFRAALKENKIEAVMLLQENGGWVLNFMNLNSKLIDSVNLPDLTAAE